MKKVNIGILLILSVSIFLYINTSYNNLLNRIHQQEDHIKHLYKEKHLQDSICNHLWDYLPLGSPVQCIILSSKFGLRKDPFSRRWKKHDGLDLKGTRQDTVYSTGGGYVEVASFYGGYGRCIIIDHGQGYKTKYAHLSKILIKEGEFIGDNTPIGKMGNSGHSTGTHLHYEIMKECLPINPLPYIYILPH